jgi:hypothetical protein
METLVVCLVVIVVTGVGIVHYVLTHEEEMLRNAAWLLARVAAQRASRAAFDQEYRERKAQFGIVEKVTKGASEGLANAQ